MPTSVLNGRAFAGLLALSARLRLGWLARYADAITDTVGQPLFNVGGYSGQHVDALSGSLKCDTVPSFLFLGPEVRPTRGRQKVSARAGKKLLPQFHRAEPLLTTEK